MAEYKSGVVYTPTPASGTQEDLTVYNDAFLDLLGIEFIRVTWVDLINNVRYRVIPRPYFKRLLESSRPGISLTKTCLGLIGLRVAEGFGSTGEDLYALDVRSFRICPYEPGRASILGFFQEKVPSPEWGLNIPLCPRTFLKRITNDAERHSGVKFLVGFESEFLLLRETQPKPLAVNEADWSVSRKLPSGSVEAKVMQEIAKNLATAGIELQMYHAEAAPGQYEIVTGPLEPLEAADALISTRETIYNVATKHGLQATFAPRLYSTSCGSAAHTHISVHEISKPTTLVPRKTDDSALGPTMTATERSFLQGILAHVPSLCALTLPTSASYARVADGVWSGGTYAVWGTENREAVVRLCSGPGQHHFEVRFVDGTANPHIALAGIIGAGAKAIKEGKPLKTRDCGKPVVLMSEEEKRAMGVTDSKGELLVGRLPSNIGKARTNLKEDTELYAVLGDVFVKRYIAVNETLEEHLKAEAEDEAVQKLLAFY